MSDEEVKVEIDPLAPKGSDKMPIPYVVLHIQPEILINQKGVTTYVGSNKTNGFWKGDGKAECRTECNNEKVSCHSSVSDEALFDAYNLKRCKVLLNRIHPCKDDSFGNRNGENRVKIKLSALDSKLRKSLEFRRRQSSRGKEAVEPVGPIDSKAQVNLSNLKQCRVVLKRISFPLDDDRARNIVQRSTRSSVNKLNNNDGPPKESSLVQKCEPTSPLRLKLKLVKESDGEDGVSELGRRSSDQNRYTCRPCEKNILRVRLTKWKGTASDSVQSSDINDLREYSSENLSHKSFFPTIRAFKQKKRKTIMKSASKSNKKTSVTICKSFDNVNAVSLKQCVVLLERISLPSPGGNGEDTEGDGGSSGSVDYTPQDSSSFEKSLDSTPLEKQHNLSETNEEGLSAIGREPV